MKKYRQSTGLMLFAAVCVLLAAPRVRADEGDSVSLAPLSRLLKAVENNVYDAFVAYATDEFKAGITKQMLQGVSGQYSDRMARGYDKVFLGQLRQQGCAVYLWKVSFKDGSDDTLARLVLKGDKVAGFWLQ